MTRDFRLVAAGDSAVILEFADRIDERINDCAIRVAAAVDGQHVAGVRDVVPTYRSVAVYFDPLRVDYAALTSVLEREAGAADPAARPPQPPRPGPVRIPVVYGGDSGPDLAEVAGFAGVTEAEVIARHAAIVYRVFMMGFVPGFAYMGTVDPAIAAPRRGSPRLRVPAGSVGIAGSQTGVYPAESPGGWQLVGRTEVRMFDLRRSEPFLLGPGDSVQFYAI